MQLAAVTPSDVDLVLTDENYKDVDYESDADLVGISVITCQFHRAMEISREFKKRGKTVIWGGIHPTAVDQSDNESIDSYVVGEAELLWPEILKDFQKGELKRRYQSEDYVDLNTIPLPKRDLIDPSVDIIETMISSRGCKYDCNYCSISIVYGKKVRWFNVDRIVEDIKKYEKQCCYFF